MKRAVLLDVSAIMYRAYFANMNFRTKNEPTGAVYGFINTLLSIIKEFNPDYMAAAFDVKRSSLKRTEIYSDYKSNRQSTPEDLVAQIPRIEEVLDAFNINRYRIESYEADDVLGSLAKKIAKDDLEVIIVTGDKDLSQLVEKNITIALLGKGTEGEKFGMLRTAEDVVNYLGVIPEKIPDLFGLIGDKSDGIPGVTKIGEKKALAIFSKYDSLEKIYENIDDLKNIEGIGPSLIKNLTNEKDIAFMSRELAKIFTDLDITVEENGLQSVKTAVGDRYVVEEMRNNNYSLGGEQSGHIILMNYATTGDGILTAVKLANIIKSTGKSLEELASEVSIYPQKLVNIKVIDKKAAMEDSEILAECEKVEKELEGNGRILLRASGTENLIRVMVEASSDELTDKYCEQVAKIVREKFEVK